MDFSFSIFMEDKLSTLAIAAQLLSIVALWVLRSDVHKLRVFFAFIIISVMAERITIVGVLSIALFGFLAWGMFRSRWSSKLRLILTVPFLVLTAGYFLHKIPGFNNWLLNKDLFLGSTETVPYSMWLNFDKPLIGYFLLLWAVPVCTSQREWLKNFRHTLLPTGLATVVVITLSIVLGYVAWDPKWNGSLFLVWILRNLFVTVIAEELFFRGLIQGRLDSWFSSRGWSRVHAIWIAAGLFGLAHIAGGWSYVFLATVAGLFYGWTYYRSRSIEMAIFTHLVINTIHILLFSYPALR